MSNRTGTPTYVKISLDIATRIYKKYLIKDAKLKGRSILSSEYGVSPETIRKAMKLLEEEDVVIVNQGSGILVKSTDAALKFIEKYEEKQNLDSLINQIKSLLEQRKNMEKDLYELNEKLIDYAYKFKSSNQFEPTEIDVPLNSSFIGKSLSEIDFWNNTNATIVGILREEKIDISPSPKTIIKEGDKLFVLGNSGFEEKVLAFIRK